MQAKENLNKERKRDEREMSIKDKKLNANKGITLVALVVTIVILLILVGITLTYVFGDNGIIKLAQQAKNETETGMQKEQDDLENLANFIQEETGNGNEGGDRKIRVGDLVGKPAKDINQAVVDDYDNRITVPAGFIVVGNGADEVEYNYSGDKRPNVQDGIVIADKEGNQFVWVPVGEIKNKPGDSNGSSTTIQLARYTFDVYGVFNEDGNDETTEGTGKITKTILTGEELKVNEDSSNVFVEETADSSSLNAKAINIEEFKDNSKINGGYYLARYEASYVDGEKFYIKPSNKWSGGFYGLEMGNVWTGITQVRAAELSRKMYTSNNFISDLTNSYAWDTAIVFIQTYSDEDYSKKSYRGGTAYNYIDKVCNIYSMASSVEEWSTETCLNYEGHAVSRGPSDVNSRFAEYTCNRHQVFNNSRTSFRPIIYINRH